jgi:hypothetical protein
MSADLRPYGPGKFSTMLDAYVYQVSLEGGCDSEAGDSSVNSWYGLMRNGRSVFRDHDPMLEQLTEAKSEFLLNAGSAGVIVREDSDGFVAVEYFDDRAALDARWQEIEAETEETEE